MKPTLDEVPSNRSRDWSRVSEVLGRPVTEEDQIKILCVWAGQAGHEKCGWCRDCHHPRWMKVKYCSHNVVSIYKGWS